MEREDQSLRPLRKVVYHPPDYNPFGNYTPILVQRFEFDVPAGFIWRINKKREDDSSSEP